MGNWLDFSFFDNVIGLLNPDLLHVFGIKPLYVQFSLVFIFVVALRWVLLPLVEWMMIKQWSVFLSYTGTVMTALLFLQLVDRYAMGNSQSSLPGFYWPVSLLALSSYGMMYILMRVLGKTVAHFRGKAKKNAA